MYRLIWFQHVHKAAGSTIVNQAIANGETLFPTHENGNPCSDDGEVIPIWDFDESKLRAFVDECESIGITFVATEWGAPDYRVLHSDPRVLLLTSIRDPWSRVVSNYNYDFYLGHSRSNSLSNYLEENHRIMMDNYLVRVFSNEFTSDPDSLDEQSVSTALENIRLFDLVLVIEREKDLSNHLFEALGWRKEQVDPHSTFGNLWTLSTLICQFRILSAVRYMFGRKLIISEEERAQFITESEMDLSFYSSIVDEKILGPNHPLFME